VTAPDRESPDRESQVLERLARWRRGRPPLSDAAVTSAHGAGGSATAALVDAVFREAYGGAELARLDDAAVLEVPRGRVAFTTDAFVVTPRRFPGGSLGTLAVCGTVNDLAVCGAVPQWLSISWVIEEGLRVEELRTIAADVALAAAEAGVAVVAGDTKVVGRGAADGVVITTAGIGVLASGVSLGADRVRPGDRVLLSGTVADHGMAVMLARGDLAIDADIESDCAPLGALAATLLDAAPGTRWMRDPTRGGFATACCELAATAGVGVRLVESAVAVRPAVRAACELLGIDPLYVANEGKLVAVVAPDEADAALAAMRSHPLGADASVVGEITTEHPGMVVAETTLGGTRLVDMMAGDPLPRIC